MVVKSKSTDFYAQLSLVRKLGASYSVNPEPDPISQG
jgi:hypothetical protein